MSTASRKPRGRSSTPTQPRKRATLKDLALALNVAPSTISNAYNRPDQLSQELRERILATARDMGYSGPHPVARGLRQQKTNTVGVIFAEQLSYAFHDPVAATFLEGVSSAIEGVPAGFVEACSGRNGRWMKPLGMSCPRVARWCCTT